MHVLIKLASLGQKQRVFSHSVCFQLRRDTKAGLPRPETEGFFLRNTNMSLEPITVWPQRYILRCERRKDLDENQGTLPDHSLYVGSSSGLTHRLCFHFTAGCGTLFTKRYHPVAVHAIDIRRPQNIKACLAWEDELVIQKMFEFMTTYTHPHCWRCCAGGSWSKPDNTRMPEPLRRRLDARRQRAPSRQSGGDAGQSLARQQSCRT
eukprot:COSAG01_NODE_6295_length_3750_cov_2.499863_2_plen_207_part_00